MRTECMSSQDCKLVEWLRTAESRQMPNALFSLFEHVRLWICSTTPTTPPVTCIAMVLFSLTEPRIMLISIQYAEPHNASPTQHV
jgi:hypothetical protein